jgi:proline dehydrogenase
VRGLILFLSRRRRLRRWLESSGTAQRLARRFVAGETLEEALGVCRRLNAEGIAVTLDHLGESVTSLEEAAEARDVCLRTLSAIVETGIRGNISVKLTQLGLDFSYEECRANMEKLAASAARLKTFVRIDMESSAYTDRTLALARELHAEHGSVGVVIQACLRRSRADVEALCREGIRVRLCKGAYLEHAGVAFPRKRDVDRNYVELLELLLDGGEYPAIATHDEKMVNAARAYAARRGVARDGFEFQMLYGIRRDLQRRLAAEGYRVRLYVPFGRAWYPYYMRRLAERPANVLFIARNLMRA